MSAEIHKLPWVANLDVARETDYVSYLRGLADLIEQGSVELEGMVVVLNLPGHQITAARVGMTGLEMAGALSVAGRLV
ncbi:MAG: hypothetical protein KGO96_12265 [Elusimicrobia bacterium]|nr:hypothetical protein [Elusimicrobiota bacterium]MDE2426671.1 hypothetical protein [Elusimicrobiota bacterium]